MKLKTLEKIEQELEDAQEKYKKQKELVQKNCEHDWETFRDYMGTSYSCKKCGAYED